MKIKEVENLTGITKANIRYYEKEGLLEPERNLENNYREYSEEDIECLERIKVLRLLGVTIAEIKQLNSGKLLLENVIENRLAQIHEEEKNLLETKHICEEILKNQLSFSAVNNELFDTRSDTWREALERIWNEDITKEMLTRKQFHKNVAGMLLWGYLINVVIAWIFGDFFLHFSETAVIGGIGAAFVIGIICYMSVYFSSDIRVQTTALHAAALTLTPLVICVYLLAAMLFNSQITAVRAISGIQVAAFWAALSLYVALFFFLTEKWDACIKEGHVVCVSFLYTALMTGLFQLAFGHWIFPAAAFLAFTLYIGSSWRYAMETASRVTELCSRYYAVNSGCRIINICGAFFSMYGKTSTSGLVLKR